MKQIITLSTLVMISMFMLVSYVRADDATSSTTTRTTLQERMQTRKDTITAHKTAVCEQVQARISNRINQYQSTRDKYYSRYYGIQKKVTDLADKLEAKGCDATQLRTDATTLGTYVDDFAASFRVFLTNIQAARGYSCDSVDTKFRTKVQDTQTQILDMRSKAQALHNFIFNTLKPHLQTVAKTCQAQISPAAQ